MFLVIEMIICFMVCSPNRRSLMGFLPVVKEGAKGFPGHKTDFQTILIAIPIAIPIDSLRGIPQGSKEVPGIFTHSFFCSFDRFLSISINYSKISIFATSLGARNLHTFIFLLNFIDFYQFSSIIQKYRFSRRV